MREKINSFSGEYAFLSNFYPAVIQWSGILYPTNEHAFQAAKSLDLQTRRKIAQAGTPGLAKRAGRLVSLREDWEDEKIYIMTDIVHAKFLQHGHLRNLLIGTGDAFLEEGNTWGDRTWGTVNGVGRNLLGIILMEVRRSVQDIGIGEIQESSL